MQDGRVKELLTPKLLVEVVVIVVGVLLALAADRWNQDRSDRILEAAYVDRFIADVRADSAGARAYLATFEVIVSATDTLLNFVEGGDPPASLPSVVQRAFAQFPLPAASTWNEILGASSLGLIQDIGVREVLSDYYGAVRPNLESNLARSDRRGRDPFTDALYPMGLFSPCMSGQECATRGLRVDGTPDDSPTYRRLDPDAFAEWPGIRELIVGLDSHHGTQRLFALRVEEVAGTTLRSLETAR